MPPATNDCAVPVYRVSYLWRGKEKQFYVVGVDRQVHAPGYPMDPARILAALLIVFVIIPLLVYAVISVK